MLVASSRGTLLLLAFNGIYKIIKDFIKFLTEVDSTLLLLLGVGT